MKKINSKGFLLLETLVVTTFVVAVLTYLYIQYINLKKNYNKSFTYNTVPGLIHAKEVDKYLNENLVYMYATNDLSSSQEKYIELASNNTCNLSYFSGNLSYCNSLINKMDIKTILLLPTSLTTPLNNIKSHYSDEFYNYIKSIKVKNDNTKYILAFEYKDKTFANILIKEAA